MTITDEMIDHAIQNAKRDQYGQVPTMNKTISSLFPNIDREIVIKHLESSKKYRLDVYSGRCGIYNAISRR